MKSKYNLTFGISTAALFWASKKSNVLFENRIAHAEEANKKYANMDVDKISDVGLK